jgi:hypothetical protein
MAYFDGDFVLSDYMYRYISAVKIAFPVSKAYLLLKRVRSLKRKQKRYSKMTVSLLSGFVMTKRRTVMAVKIKVCCCVMQCSWLGRK